MAKICVADEFAKKLESRIRAFQKKHQLVDVLKNAPPLIDTCGEMASQQRMQAVPKVSAQMVEQWYFSSLRYLTEEDATVPLLKKLYKVQPDLKPPFKTLTNGVKVVNLGEQEETRFEDGVVLPGCGDYRTAMFYRCLGDITEPRRAKKSAGGVTYITFQRARYKQHPLMLPELIFWSKQADVLLISRQQLERLNQPTNHGTKLADRFTSLATTVPSRSTYMTASISTFRRPALDE